MAELVIDLQNVTMKADRGGTVFRDLNLAVEPGSSAIISGGSGSGKTLLVELLMGMRFPDAGTVHLFGLQLKRRHKRVIRKIRRKIGGIGGPFELIPSLTVSENITLPLVISGERRKVQRDRLRGLLSEHSLLNVAGKYPGQLTRVESSLVQFARATIANQPLVIMDEPLVGLDERTYERVSQSLVKTSLSGQSMLILVSEPPVQSIPGAKLYRLNDGVIE